MAGEVLGVALVPPAAGDVPLVAGDAPVAGEAASNIWDHKIIYLVQLDSCQNIPPSAICLSALLENCIDVPLSLHGFTVNCQDLTCVDAPRLACITEQG